MENEETRECGDSLIESLGKYLTVLQLDPSALTWMFVLLNITVHYGIGQKMSLYFSGQLRKAFQIITKKLSMERQELHRSSLWATELEWKNILNWIKFKIVFMLMVLMISDNAFATSPLPSVSEKKKKSGLLGKWHLL